MRGTEKKYIPARFQHAIMLHLIKNSMEASTPLILGIQGAPGEGKTFQTYAILDRLDIATVTIAGRELESDLAGNPAKYIIEKYKYASDLAITTDKKVCMLINDIDSGIGNFGSLVQYTMNTQHVCSTLMELCDFPTRVDDETVARIPIIATANDFTKVYPPLTRPGRMSIFTWVPTESERFDIIQSIFENASIEKRILKAIFDRYPTQSISFFADIRNSLLDQRIIHIIDQEKTSATLKDLLISIQDKMSRDMLPITESTLIEIAERLAKTSLVNYIERASQ
jgi:ATP-dependent 26S proteasome regulatory subunit